MTPREPLAAVQALYDRSLFLSAHRAAQALGPYREWEGARALLLAGRLCGQLGAQRQAEILIERAYRADPTDPAARYFHASRALRWRGPLAGWRLLRREGELTGADADTLGSWFALHASALAALRDFERAWQWWQRAVEAAPDSAWVRSRRAELLSREDRHPEALEASREALALHPGYRVAVLGVAHELTNLDRVEEAERVLAQADREIECADVAAMRGGLCEELGRHPDAARCWDRYRELSPLLEPGGVRWLAGRRSDTAYYLGDLPASARLARRAGGGFFEKVAARLEALSGAERVVRLPVGFVKQHHLTCAPATVAMLSAFWEKPLDHLALAGEICYAGTPDHVQRDWLERHGWISLAFRVTWDAAVALLDRGVPFALGTRELTTGHLQAVIGYDGRRRTLLLRDPNARHQREVDGEGFLAAYQSCGPRGVALVPAEAASRLDGLALPDTALYDLEYQMKRALQAQDRAGAGQAWEALRASAPDHWLTHTARLDLAAYDGDDAARLGALDRLSALFPDERRFALQRVGCLRELARSEDRVRHLRAFALSRERGSPFFWEQYAEELRLDAREHAPAQRLLRRAIAAAPDSAMAYHILGDLHWGRRELDEALELYRFAACLDDTDEHLAYAFFVGTRAVGRTDDGLAFLAARARRLGRQSGNAARTAFDAYDELQRAEAGFALLDEALALRPDDGELLLFTANQHGRFGRLDRAQELLTAAAGRVHPAARLRALARLARTRGEAAEATRHWREVAAQEPRALDAHRELAMDLADREGMPAALAFLRGWAEASPHHFGVWQLVCEWMRRGDPGEAEACLRRLLDHSPQSAWTHRELGWNLLLRRRFPQAQEALDAAIALEPHSAFGHAARARLLRETGRLAEAAESARAALRLSADTDLALDELLELAQGREERRAALTFLHGELLRQNVEGDGLEAFHQCAEGVLEPAQLLPLLQALRERHPGLWQSWVCELRQLLSTRALEEAGALARQATLHFPLLPRAWVERARVARARGDGEDERASLEQALAISPGWGEALRLLSEWHDRRGDLAQARRALEQAVARAPRDPVNRGCLADLLWRQGERERALAEVEAAARLDPDYGWSWGRLSEWGAELGRPELTARVVRELAAARPDDVRTLLLLAQRLCLPEDLPERLAALDRALALAPRHLDAHTLKAELLAEAGRLDEARAACRPAALGGAIPARLQGAEAYALAQAGEVHAAVARMREVLAGEPDYFAGWGQLADWCERLQDREGYRAAAERMVQLQPGNCVGHGYLGHALELAGDRQQARAAFRTALSLDPAYTYAAAWAFDLALADREPDEARSALEVLRGRLDAPRVLEREIRLAARSEAQGSWATALDRLDALALACGDDPQPLGRALQALEEVGLASEAHGRLQQAVLRADAAPAAGSAWAQVVLRSLPVLRVVAQVDTVLAGAPTPAAARAAGEIVGRLAEAGQRRAVRDLVRRCGGWLTRDPFCWGEVGYALFLTGRFRDAVRWLQDHRARAGVEPWMLGNLSASLQALGRMREAFEVSRSALALPPDQASPRHRLVVALGDALAGGAEQAARDAAAVRLDSLPRDAAFTRALVDTVAAAAQLPAGAPLEALAPLRSHLARARAAHPGFAACADDAALYALVLAHTGSRPVGLVPRLWTLAQRLLLRLQRWWVALRPEPTG